MKKIAIVVVTYNRKLLLEECIKALLNQSYQNYEILIINNCSTDGTEKHINYLIDNKKVFLHNTDLNLGGAGGFNYGMKQAMKTEAEFIWLMDDDCIVNKDSLKKLIEADEKLNGNYGFLSSVVLWKDGTLCKMNIQKETITKKNTDFNMPIKPIVMASFVSFFVKNSVVKEVGLPIKDFFIWSDDLEYSRRISLKYKCYLIGNSKVIHKSSSNVGSNIANDNVDRLKLYEYAYRNEVVLYRREGVCGWVYMFVRLILHSVRVLKSKIPDKKERLKIIYKSTLEGIKFKPKIEYVGRTK